MTECAVSPMPDLVDSQDQQTQRWQIQLQGIVQGVGFRPFVYRLATDLGLTGWVRNTDQGLQIEVEGTLTKLAQFTECLKCDAPSHSVIVNTRKSEIPLAKTLGFQILDSQATSHEYPNQFNLANPLGNLILPDLATCKDCVAELFDPKNHRYRYPFLNCTCCGPRYSILQRLPYDRAHTTMADFAMCPVCRREYDDPLDRRFHAQPTACPQCGPQIQFLDRNTANNIGDSISTDIYGENALAKAIVLLRAGGILAVKGLGGFHLVTLARNQEAVMELRHRKRRKAKPLAVMVPSVAWLKQYIELTALEINLLESAAAPIVLLPWSEKERQQVVTAAVAPDNPYLGIMLPYTPLHHLLLADLGEPIVATSGNLSSETICIDEMEALTRLKDIADGFLVHNRQIVRAVDDSVVRVVAGEPMILRRARGYAPLPIQLAFHTSQERSSKSELPQVILSLGGHLKNTIALGYATPQSINSQLQEWQILISQHLGDLGSPTTLNHFRQTIQTMIGMYGITPQALGCDTHPDYVSTQFAQQFAQQFAERLVLDPENQIDDQMDSQISSQKQLPIISIQHHYAHVLAVMAEHQLENGSNNESNNESNILGIAWDGTGYGSDGTIWGGEFLLVPPTKILGQTDLEPSIRKGYERIGHWRPFPLVGGDLAIQEPRRSLLGLMYGCFGDKLPWDDFPVLQSFSRQQRGILLTALARITEAHQATAVFDSESDLSLAIKSQSQESAKQYSGLGMMTSSVGRLFDGVAALLNLCAKDQTRIDFEGQAAMQLEFAIQDATEKLVKEDAGITYPFRVISDHNASLATPSLTTSIIIDWKPMIKAILIELYHGVSVSKIALTFHNTLVATIVMMAQRYPNSPVVLTGGCFQNLYLLSRTIAQLKQHHIPVYWAQKIPCHDGGLSVGQIYGVLRHYAGFINQD